MSRLLLSLGEISKLLSVIDVRLDMEYVRRMWPSCGNANAVSEPGVQETVSGPGVQETVSVQAYPVRVCIAEIVLYDYNTINYQDRDIRLILNNVNLVFENRSSCYFESFMYPRRVVRCDRPIEKAMVSNYILNNGCTSVDDIYGLPTTVDVTDDDVKDSMIQRADFYPLQHVFPDKFMNLQLERKIGCIQLHVPEEYETWLDYFIQF